MKKIKNKNSKYICLSRIRDMQGAFCINWSWMPAVTRKQSLDWVSSEPQIILVPFEEQSPDCSVSLSFSLYVLKLAKTVIPAVVERTFTQILHFSDDCFTLYIQIEALYFIKKMFGLWYLTLAGPLHISDELLVVTTKREIPSGQRGKNFLYFTKNTITELQMLIIFLDFYSDIQGFLL